MLNYCVSNDKLSSLDSVLHILSHHKTGTALSQSIYGFLCFNNDQEVIFLKSKTMGQFWSIYNKETKYNCTNVTFGIHGINDTSEVYDSNKYYIHLIRHPIDVLVSGYLYHRACSEKWTMVDDEKNRNKSYEFTYMFPPIFPIQGSYCQYLQKVNISEGLRIEFYRAMHAKDGILKMLNDEETLLSLNHNSISICMSNLKEMHDKVIDFLIPWNQFNRTNIQINDMEIHHSKYQKQSKRELFTIARDVVLNVINYTRLHSFPCASSNLVDTGTSYEFI